MEPTLLLPAAFLCLWAFVQVTLHECAHLVAAKAVGFSAFSFTVGTGPLAFQHRAAGIDFRFHCFPSAGLVKAIPRLDGLRWRGAVFSGAGLILDAVIFIAALGQADFRLDATQGTPARTLFAAVAVYQGVIIALNLVPMHSLVQGCRLPNDGRQLMDYLSGATPRTLRAYEANVMRYDASFRIGQSWLMRGDLPLLALLAAGEADMAAGRYEDATQKYAELLERTSMHPAERAVILDAMASIPVVHGGKRFLAAAEDWARQACRLVPDCRTSRGTLGSILVEKGAAAEGLALLLPLTSDSNSPIDRTLASCYIAKAFDALGDAVQAGKWIEAARSLGVFPHVCARVESELARASGASA